MSDVQAPRKKPVLRKERVETDSWGAIIVRQFNTTARMECSAAFTPPPDPKDEQALTAALAETELSKRARARAEYSLFLAMVLERAVIGLESDEPLYTAEEWDAWGVQEGEAINADVLKVTDKALAMNGYRTLSGEDVAKNA